MRTTLDITVRYGDPEAVWASVLIQQHRITAPKEDVERVYQEYLAASDDEVVDFLGVLAVRRASVAAVSLTADVGEEK